MKVLLMAGGKGTRMMKDYLDIPKVMIPINKKPLLEWQILQLKKQGFSDICIIDNEIVHKRIYDHFGYGNKFKINIGYYTEQRPLGTAGVLSEIYGLLPPSFLMIFGDLLFSIDLNKFIKAFLNHQETIMAVIHKSDHPFDSSKIEINFDTAISWHGKNTEFGGNLTTAGIFAIDKKVIDRRLRIADLDRDYLQPLISNYKLKVYLTEEYIKDAGTPERLIEVDNYLKDHLEDFC